MGRSAGPRTISNPILFAVAVGVQTLRGSPLHTLLSTLGIVVGVASLVAILSLGDGLEIAAREQIESTTDFQLISVSPRETERIDGVLVRKANVPQLTVADIALLQTHLGETATAVLITAMGAEVTNAEGTRSRGAVLTATLPAALMVAGDSLAAGRFLEPEDIALGAPVAVLSHVLADALAAPDAPATLVGSTVRVQDVALDVVGVLHASTRGDARLFVPVGTAVMGAATRSPDAWVKVHRIEDVGSTREVVEGWLASQFSSADDFTVQTNEWRVAQTRRAVLLFKLVMGAITGISIIVGGIGVMNVLLVSIAQRTREIGVRRAAGARRRDVLLQFLVESVVIAGAGSLLGLALGLGAVFAFVPVARHLTEIPFRAGVSVSTVVVALATAALVGIVFGTYPAWRAAHLEPVDALRHE